MKDKLSAVQGVGPVCGECESSSEGEVHGNTWWVSAAGDRVAHLVGVVRAESGGW